jgi:uncharacterized protein YjeT (DUF2065 family)
VSDLLTGLALVLVIEGAVFALFPGRKRNLLTTLLTLPDNVVRLTGLLSVALGVFAVWMIRG